jgi:hypothetical protein
MLTVVGRWVTGDNGPPVRRWRSMNAHHAFSRCHLIQGVDVNSTSLRHILHQLAESGRTGALHVDGGPGGVLYLVSGHITHAESPACPGIGERLVASGRLSAAAWKDAYAEAAGRHQVGRQLVRDGHIGQNELACRMIATIGDVTHALLQSDDAPVRFAPGERHWLGVIAQLELGALIHETAKRLRTVPAPRTRQELPWAGRPHPAWPRRAVVARPDYAALKRIRATVTQGS